MQKHRLRTHVAKLAALIDGVLDALLQANTLPEHTQHELLHIQYVLRDIQGSIENDK